MTGHKRAELATCSRTRPTSPPRPGRPPLRFLRSSGLILNGEHTRLPFPARSFHRRIRLGHCHSCGGELFCGTYHPMANLFEPPRYIAIEGPIRVGKSTLARIVSERMNAQRVIEPEDNPFLAAFYEGERGAAFQAQFTFLVQRYEQLRVLEAGPNSHK